jgi:hypothetical protein
VAAALLAIWLPFVAFAGRELSRPLPRASLSGVAEERALAVVEPLALVLVVMFAFLHGAQFAWPLLTGNLTEGDLRPELIATLSGTQRGVPVQAIAYLCGVGASSFYALRQAKKTALAARPALARGLLALCLLSYLLGSYAVIRCASGAILP